jgi:hypothetical protein
VVRAEVWRERRCGERKRASGPADTPKWGIPSTEVCDSFMEC